MVFQIIRLKVFQVMVREDWTPRDPVGHVLQPFSNVLE